MMVELPCDSEERVLAGRMTGRFHVVPGTDVAGYLIEIADNAGTPLALITLAAGEWDMMRHELGGVEFVGKIVTGGE